MGATTLTGFTKYYLTATATIKKNKIFLPKIGEVKAVFHRNTPLYGIKTVTVSFEAGQYFASINYEESNLPNPKNNGKAVALDVGVKFSPSQVKTR